MATLEQTRGEDALRVFLVLLGALLVANNLLPYVGLRDDSCQTMFSGLECGEGDNNHLFMPQYALSDGGAYHVDVQVTLDPPPEQDGHDDMLLRWLHQPHRALNTEATRVVLDQLCRHRRVSMRWRMHHHPEVHESQNACEDAALSSPTGVPFRLWFIPSLAALTLFGVFVTALWGWWAAAILQMMRNETSKET